MDKPKRTPLMKVCIAVLWLLLCVGLPLSLIEIFSRTVMKNCMPQGISDERSLTYDYHPVLGWAPQKNSQKTFTGSTPIHVQHNSQGFRDVEHGPKTKPRILFLGDSFVWGYDVEAEQRFTNKLQSLIPQWEIINCGVSGYGTDQEFLLLQREYNHYRPDVVFVMVDGTDRGDNSATMRYGYYKPYFLKDADGQIRVHGIPVRRNMTYWMRKPLVRNLHSLQIMSWFMTWQGAQHDQGDVIPDVTEDLIKQISLLSEKNGCRFFLGLIDPDEQLKSYCLKENIPLCDLTKIDADYRFHSFGWHWNDVGHTMATQLICEFLAQQGILTKESSQKSS